MPGLLSQPPQPPPLVSLTMLAPAKRSVHPRTPLELVELLPLTATTAEHGTNNLVLVLSGPRKS